MLNWVSPGLFWLAALAAPVVFFYFLRMRFRQQPVSSVYLWNRLAASLHYGSRLRIRSIFLLILQVIAVLSMVFAVANPFWQRKSLIKPGTVYLIDVSGSMASQDVMVSGIKSSRIRAACDAVQNELKKMPEGTPAAVFLCGAHIRPLGDATVNHQLLINRLNGVAAGAEGFREEPVSAAIKTWLATHDHPWQGILLTDGGVDLGGTLLADEFSGAFRIKTFGRNAHDIGITGLRLDGKKVRFWIYNGWSDTRRVGVGLWKDKRHLTTAMFSVVPGAAIYQLPNPQGEKTGLYQIRLDKNRDILPLDDQCLLAVNSVKHFKIIAVGPGNAFLRALLNNPLIDFAEASEFPPGFTGKLWDLVIADRVAPPQTIATNLLTFGNSRSIKTKSVVSGTLVPADSGHPLLRYFDPDGVQVDASLILPVDGTTQILATIDGEPVMTVRKRGPWKNVDCGFHLLNSNLGLSRAFPIMLQNYLQWIVPQGGNPLADTLTAGETYYRSESPEWKLRDNGGIGWERQNAFIKLSPVQPGVYEWKERDAAGVLAVNLPASELDVEPRAIAPIKHPAYLGAELKVERIPLTDWFIVVFLTAVLAEWIVWRGGTGHGTKALLSFTRGERG